MFLLRIQRKTDDAWKQETKIKKIGVKVIIKKLRETNFGKIEIWVKRIGGVSINGNLKNWKGKKRARKRVKIDWR